MGTACCIAAGGAHPFLFMNIIKRYANRKFYDTRAKRYVTLDDLAQLVYRGEDFHVVDHATGQDLTQQILAQIIFERQKTDKGHLPQVTLKAMIQASNQALTQLRSALPWPEATQAQVDAEIKRRLDLLIAWGDLTPEQASDLSAELVQAGRHPSGEPEMTAADLERELRGRGVPTREDLQNLEDRLAALAAELERLAPKEN